MSNRIWCFKMNMTSFPSLCADDFYIMTTQWLFLGFIWPYKSVKLAGLLMLMHLHRKWYRGSVHFIPLSQCLQFQYWSNSGVPSLRQIWGWSYSRVLSQSNFRLDDEFSTTGQWPMWSSSRYLSSSQHSSPVKDLFWAKSVSPLKMQFQLFKH